MKRVLLCALCAIGLLLPIEKTTAKELLASGEQSLEFAPATCHLAPVNIKTTDWYWVGDALVFDTGSATDIISDMEIYNSSQQLVLSTGCGGSNCSINTSTLGRGTYTAYAYSTSGTHSKGFSK